MGRVKPWPARSGRGLLDSSGPRWGGHGRDHRAQIRPQTFRTRPGVPGRPPVAGDPRRCRGRPARGGGSRLDRAATDRGPGGGGGPAPPACSPDASASKHDDAPYFPAAPFVICTGDNPSSPRSPQFLLPGSSSSHGCALARPAPSRRFPTGEVSILLFYRRRASPGLGRFPHMGFDGGGHLGVLPQVLLGVLPPLPDPLLPVGIERAALLD